MALGLSEYFPGDTRSGRTDHYLSGLKSDTFGVYWSGVGSAADTVHVRVLGQAFRSVSVDEGLEVVRMLDGWGVTASRFDLARDIPELSTAHARSLVQARECRTRVQSIDWIEGLRGRNGRTLMVGNRTSDRVVRVYDYRGPTRIEVELHRAYAAAAVDRLLRGRESFVDVWRSEVRATIDFPTWPEWQAALA